MTAAMGVVGDLINLGIRVDAPACIWAFNPADEVVAEMQQLYDKGIRNFWFTDAQFIPARRYIEDAKELIGDVMQELKARG